MLCMRNVLMNIFYSEVVLAPLATEINSHQGLNCFQIVPLALNNANKVLGEGGGDALSRLVKPLPRLSKWPPLKSQSIFYSEQKKTIRQLLISPGFFCDENESDNLAHQMERFPNLSSFFIFKLIKQIHPVRMCLEWAVKTCKLTIRKA